jgi:hypothetical protein
MSVKKGYEIVPITKITTRRDIYKVIIFPRINGASFLGHFCRAFNITVIINSFMKDPTRENESQFINEMVTLKIHEVANYLNFISKLLWSNLFVKVIGLL